MLLLGAVRCINACQLPDEPVKKCHQDPAAPKVKVCGQLNIATSEDDAPAIPIAVHIEPIFVTVAVPLPPSPALLIPHGPPHVPLRL